MPYNTVVLYAVAPSGSESRTSTTGCACCSRTSSRTSSISIAPKAGRASRAASSAARRYAFPNLFLPPWQIEGLATYEESAITGEGRLHAGDFLAIVGEAARQRRLEPLDRVNGGLTDWPGGAGVYAYGVGFHQYLAERFGAETLGDAGRRRPRGRVP